MEKFIGYLIVILGVIGILCLVAIVTALPVMWLWNWLMPVIFELPMIDFWQALGLCLFCSLLFKSSCSKKE